MTSGEPLPDRLQDPVEQQPADHDALVHLLAAEQLGAGDQGMESLGRNLADARRSSDPALAEEVTRLATSIGAWDVVAAGATRWRELAADQSAPLFFLVRARLELGDADGAAEALETLIETAEDPTMAWQQAAALLARSPDEALALEVMEHLIEGTGEAGDPDALWGQSALAWRLADPDRALELGEAAAARSDNVEQLLWTAQLAASQGFNARALELYQRTLEFEPDNVEAQMAIAEILRRQGAFAQSRAVLKDMPADTDVLYTLGVYLAQDDLPDEAFEVWQRLAALEVTDRATHAFFTGHLARIIERAEDAARWFEQVDDGPMHANAMLQRALLAAERQDVAQARQLLGALRRDRHGEMIEQSWLLEAHLLQDAGHSLEAIDVLSDALVELPGSVALLYSRALVAVEIDDLDLAEQDLRQILQLEPNSALALNALGYTLTDRTDRHHEAYRLIRRALEQTPDDPAVLDSMGWVYFRLGQPEQALGYLRRALDTGYDPEIAAHLGEVLWTLGEREEARSLLDEGVSRHPEHAGLLETRSRLGLAMENATGSEAP